MKKSTGILFLGFICLLWMVVLAACATQTQARPNIVWILAEDQSDHYGVYGEKLVTTPNVDRLAAEGVKFSSAFVTAPVCSPSRSAVITGMYQTTTGTHQHRSSRGKVKINLPPGIKTIPELFKEAGYYVSNGHPNPGGKKYGTGKTDYNFVYPEDLYDGTDWSGRKPGQPFFTQLMLKGGKYRIPNEKKAWYDEASAPEPVDPASVKLPPYYPDDPVIREDWALYLDSINYVDQVVGHTMKRLNEEGLADNTIVFFWTDHGISHARGKQFLYEEGIKVPLIVWGPGRVDAGGVRNDLVPHIDMSATSLYFAGIPIPNSTEGRPLFGPLAKPREYVVTARDRCDETVERIRSVRTNRYKYIRNYYPERPHLQPDAYKDAKEILKRLRELHAAGKLNALQEKILFSPKRAPEELYDLDNDPWELNNLAGEPAQQETLARLRGTLDNWIKETGDKGEIPESEQAYDGEMDVYVTSILKSRREDRANTIRKNIEQMKRWAAEGK